MFFWNRGPDADDDVIAAPPVDEPDIDVDDDDDDIDDDGDDADVDAALVDDVGVMVGADTDDANGTEPLGLSVLADIELALDFWRFNLDLVQSIAVRGRG
jgi:hypothetical protein